jgi:nicotinamidase/pyrazinamidase
MKTALICVDVENDFLPGGSLAVPNGDEVIPALIDLIPQADLVVLTRDYHPSNHCSFANEPKFVDGSWPAHCVIGTEGAKFDDRLIEAIVESGKPWLIVHKGVDPDREEYSGATGRIADAAPGVEYTPGDTLWVALNKLGVRKLIVGGLALDYCVRATALDLHELVGDTTVVAEATRPVDYLGGLKAVLSLRTQGVEIAT